MRKILMTLLLFPTLSFSQDGIFVINNNLCSNQQYIDELNSNGFIIIKQEDDNTFSLIDKVNNKGKSLWSEKITKYKTIYKNTNGYPPLRIEKQFDKFKGKVKNYILNNTSCLTYGGYTSISEDNNTNESGGINLEDLGVSIDYDNLISARLPSDDNKPVILLPDSPINSTQIFPPSENIISSIGSSDSACDGMNITNDHSKTTHATVISNAMALINKDSLVRGVITHCSGTKIDLPELDLGLSKAIEGCKNGELCVLNKSNAAKDGNAPSTLKILKTAHDKGIAVVQSVGNNFNIENNEDYNSNIIRVGTFLLQEGKVFGTVGSHGPDILVPINQNGLEPGYFNDIKDEINYLSYFKGGNSLATGVVSSVISILQDHCRLSSEGTKFITPDQIKDILISTSKRLPVLPESVPDTELATRNKQINLRNSYVKGGILDPLSAITKVTELCKVSTDKVKLFTRTTRDSYQSGPKSYENIVSTCTGEEAGSDTLVQSACIRDKTSFMSAFLQACTNIGGVVSNGFCKNPSTFEIITVFINVTITYVDPNFNNWAIDIPIIYTSE